MEVLLNWLCFSQILELQKQLENQFVERGALETAMFSKPVSDDFAKEYSISKVVPVFLSLNRKLLFC